MDPKPAGEPVKEAAPTAAAPVEQGKETEEAAAPEVASTETKTPAVDEVEKTEFEEVALAVEKKEAATEISSSDEPKEPQVEEPDQPNNDDKEEKSKAEVETSKVQKADSTQEEQEDDEEEDPTEEKFEDAVDSVAKLEEVEVTTEPAKEATPEKKLPEVASERSSIELKPTSSEDLITLRVTESESYEIEDSPEKSPVKVATPAPKPRPGPSSVVARQLPIKSPEIETVDLDDDDDDDDEAAEREPRMTRVRDDYDDEEDDDFDEDDDDYYDDPESDDQDINRVIQDAVDEINAMDDPESGEEDKMDVSSDDEDYSDDNDEQPSVVMPKGGASAKSGSGKRKRSDYSEDEEVYDEDVEDDEDDDDEVEDDDDDIAEVVESDTKVLKRKPSQASVSMGQISVEDESDEDVQDKKKVRKVKYKSYQQKLVAGIKRRTFKLLNKRSMHVMEEGGDVLVCSDAKIVSLKSAVSSVAKPKAEEATVVSKVTTDVVKEPKAKDQLAKWSDASTTEERSSEPPAESSVDTPKVVPVSGGKKDEENKENMTIKDNAKELPRKAEVDEKEKAKDEDRRRDRRPARPVENEEVIDEVMDDIDDIIEDAKYQNGSKADYNDELTFQMDVESQPDDEDPYDDEEEDDDEEGAVDLSSYDANKSDREDYGKQSQTDESDAVELIDSSPEKSSSASSVTKPVRKPGPLRLDRDFGSSRKVSTEKPVTVKKEVEDVSEEKQEAVKEPSVSASKSSPRKEAKLLEKTREVETATRKRRRSVDSDECEEEEEPLVPSKKLKRELECNYKSHDRLLKEYIETTSNKTVDDVQKHTDALVVEIRTLNEMIRAKETEWNNMIHLKKVKEEILLRLTRKKHVMDIIETKLGEVSEYTHFDSSNLSNVRSASVGPRPPTPPPEVDIRPASVTPMHSSTINTSKNAPNTSTHSISGSRHLSLTGSKDNNLFAQFNHSNSSVTMVPLSTSSSSLITSTNTILQSRANMKSAEVAKEKSNAVQIQRQILPKPILSNHQQILNNLAMSAGLTAAAATSSGPTSISNSAPTATVASAAAAAMAANNILAGLSAQAAALLNGHHNPSGSNHLQQGNHLQVGRQGVIKDVKSIIADYRQKHPEQVPRRGRRLKNIPNTGYEGGSLTITNRGGGSSRMTELGFLLAAAEQQQQQQQNAASHLSKGAYPEVTLHPVTNSSSASGTMTAADMNHSTGSNASANHSTNSTNSLLHGILTKSSSRPNATGFTSFSPTLARLLTAPERMNSQAATVTSGALANLQASTGLNLSKSNSEITITPVGASNLQQNLLAHQQQLQEQQKQLQRLREQHFLNMDDEADDSVDRLVIDEGDDHHHGTSSRGDGGHHREREPSVVITTRGGNGPEFHENEVPECQGCKKREAQFVCAGCGNQWYCSRECQVNAWDDHSEICTG